MAKNRTIPYGYKIENGQITINEEEKDVLVEIFNMYENGNSYKNIAEELTRQNKRYEPDKATWNKNMIARILQNENYTNKEKYPQIISNDKFKKIQSNKKAYRITESAEVKKIKKKLLCGICGCKIKRRIKPTYNERWYCEKDIEHISLSLRDEKLVDDTKRALKSINISTIEYVDNSNKNTEIRLANEIKQMIEKSLGSSEDIENKIIELVENQFENLNKIKSEKEYLELKIQRFIQDENLLEVLDVVKTIKVINFKITEIIFVNDINYRLESEKNE